MSGNNSFIKFKLTALLLQLLLLDWAFLQLWPLTRALTVLIVALAKRATYTLVSGYIYIENILYVYWFETCNVITRSILKLHSWDLIAEEIDHFIINLLMFLNNSLRVTVLSLWRPKDREKLYLLGMWYTWGGFEAARLQMKMKNN